MDSSSITPIESAVMDKLSISPTVSMSEREDSMVCCSFKRIVKERTKELIQAQQPAVPLCPLKQPPIAIMNYITI